MKILKFLFLLLFTISAGTIFTSQAMAQNDEGGTLIRTLKSPEKIPQIAKQDKFRDPNAVKVLTWLYLTQYPDYASFKMLKDFLAVSTDWPQETMLKRKLENKFPSSARPYEVKNWFDSHPPVTATGLNLYMNALDQLGYRSEAARTLRTFWYDANLSNNDTALLAERYKSYFNEQDHINRANNLIWDGKTSSAKALFPFISESRRKVLQARIMLANEENGVDQAIEAIPESRRLDPGLIYERVRWRRRAGLDSGALELLNDTRVNQSDHPDKWWMERHILLRRAIERGDYKKALNIVQQHRQNTDFPFTQAESIKGWLTLINEPSGDRASKIFTRLYDAVETPMSKTRAAYWAGRAFQKSGELATAEKWYARAADDPLFYYGQLANDRLGRSRLNIRWVEADEALANKSALVYHPFASAIRVLTNAGLPEYNDAFFVKLLAMAKTEADFQYVAWLGKASHRFDYAVRAAKLMYNEHGKMLRIGYPNLPHLNPEDTSQSHILGLIRQESIFNPRAGSHVGAKGLMQLMPPTAKEQAQKLGLPYSLSRLLDDPEYNTTLGTAYIERMLRYYDGNYVLATAAYNAGFGRVNGWIKTFGDPRDPRIDIVDWIESLPVYETRNYVQRVLEASRVYDEMFNATPPSYLSRNYRL